MSAPNWLIITCEPGLLQPWYYRLILWHFCGSWTMSLLKSYLLSGIHQNRLYIINFVTILKIVVPGKIFISIFKCLEACNCLTIFETLQIFSKGLKRRKYGAQCLVSKPLCTSYLRRWQTAENFWNLMK